MLVLVLLLGTPAIRMAVSCSLVRGPGGRGEGRGGDWGCISMAGVRNCWLKAGGGGRGGVIHEAESWLGEEAVWAFRAELALVCISYGRDTGLGPASPGS